MLVSMKSEYGLRALIYFAEHSGRAAVPAHEIADAWHVPIKYLEQILKLLKTSGFVESQVGTGGGYRLTRPATSITVGDVVRALEGGVATLGYPGDEYAIGDSVQERGLFSLWSRTQAAIEGVLDATTVADLCYHLHDRSQPGERPLG